MTGNGAETIEINFKLLAREARARCAMCGTSLDLGRVKTIGFDWGIVLCGRHAAIVADAIVQAFTDGQAGLWEVLHGSGLS